MSQPLVFTRDAADVQAMRLDSVRAMQMAARWLWDHGVGSARWGVGRRVELVIYGPGSRMVARLGDWLTLDMRTAVFAVMSAAEFETAGHKRAGDGE